MDWKSNKKAWMTGKIMSEWLQQFKRKMQFHNRNINLFLDNATSHPSHINFTNVKIIRLTPNTTTVCQPLDESMFQTFKIFYRSSMLQYLPPNLCGRFGIRVGKID